MIDAPKEAAAAQPSPLPGTPATQRGIEIAFADCTVRVGEHADLAMLRAVVALLRR